MDPLPVLIRVTQNPKDIRALGPLRVEAWKESGALFHPGFLPDDRTWIDPTDFKQNTYHWIAEYDGMVVGAARVSYHDSLLDVPDGEQFNDFVEDFSFPVASINRMFVRKEFWGFGIGSKLDAARLDFIMRSGVPTVLAFACGIDRAKRLEKRGFRILAVRDEDHDIIIPKKFYALIAELNAIDRSSPKRHHETAVTASHF